MRHLLVSNDFPPKVGGIQSYMWELWRRLPHEDVTVLTTPYPGAAEFDRAQPFTIVRTRQRVLFPTPRLAERIRRLAAERDAQLVVLDPVLPLGLLGRRLGRPYAVVAHGAEVAVPGRLPASRALLARVVGGSSGVIAAGGYPAAEVAEAAGSRAPAIEVVPPGVDVSRFRPLTGEQKAKARAELGLPVEGRLILSVSRLVPRKGMDVLIESAARLRRERPDLTVAIAGSGRDRHRLERLIARSGAPVRLLGRVADDRLPDAYGCADVFAMLCRDRWGGLEQEGFGIVFLEAAACGVPQVAGRSGGAGEAVTDAETGLVVGHPRDVEAVTAALARLLDDDAFRQHAGDAARRRAERAFSYDESAKRLASALEEFGR